MPKDTIAALDRLAAARGGSRSEALAYALAQVDLVALVETVRGVEIQIEGHELPVDKDDA